MKRPSASPLRIAKKDGVRAPFDFSDRRLVECPNCSGCATITPFGDHSRERLTCVCGARRESIRDPLVGYEPWLRVETR